MAGESTMSLPTRLGSALRLRSWAHFLLLPLASVDLTVGTASAAAAALRGVAISFAVLAFGYLLNGVSDRSLDRSAEKNALVDGGPPGFATYALLSALAALSLGLAVTGPVAVVVATTLCLGSGVLYSVGPRLKRFPIVGTLMNVTNFAPLLWVGLATEDFPLRLAALSAAFTALLLQNQLLHEAADRDDDAHGRVVTTVLAFGTLTASVHAAVLGLFVVTTAYMSDLPLLVPPFVVVFVVAFPMLLARRGADVAAMARARHVHRGASLVAGATLYALL